MITFKKKQIAKKSVNFDRWYTDVILRSELADYAPVKGCMVIMPWGYEIWEHIQSAFNLMIKQNGVKNAYFPLFIPESLLRKEKEHVEGFSPELAVVTIGGGEKLKEPLIVRPTSETIMYEMYARWLHSWRDLPILINQWNNVVRWEKRTYLFLRTTEFLWQEGHTVHETHEDCLNMTHKALNWYIDLYRNEYAMDGIAGIKSNSQKFAGALKTYTFEMLMPDKKALQGCTSHDLGQNFARVFNMKFLGRSGKEEIPWQTSWGISTRSIGALIMTHGDDNGLILPPRLSPLQIIIVPILTQKSNKENLLKLVNNIKKELKGYRLDIDNREEQSVGWKFNEWELKGVPLRIEIGERELRNDTVVLARRDTGDRKIINITKLKQEVKKTLDDIQRNMLQRSRKFLKVNTHYAKSYSEFKKIMDNDKGFIYAFWCEDSKCEDMIQKETKATIRCLPLDAKVEKGQCIYCGNRASYRWVFAQAY